MTSFSRSELNAALKELLGLRGSIALGFDETIVPVVIVGDARTLQASWPRAFAGINTAAGVVGSRSWVYLENPADSGVIVTVEHILARTYGVGQFAQLFYGTLVHDFPPPVLAGGGQSGTPDLRIAPSARGAPRLLTLPMIVRHGTIVAPGNAGKQIASRITETANHQESVWDHRDPPIVLPPDSWVGVKNGANDLSLDAFFRGRAWPLG